MLRYVKFLLTRFAELHLRVLQDRIMLESAELGLIGWVERLERRSGSVAVTGWMIGSHATLVSPNAQRTVQVQIARPDVDRALGIPDSEVRPKGFELTLPKGAQDLTLVAEGDGWRESFVLPRPSWRDRLQARVVLAAHLARCLKSSWPLAWRYWRFRDPATREQLKQALGLSVSSPIAQLDGSFFRPTSPSEMPEKLSIILPVFNALDLLPEVLRRVVAHTNVPFRLILIEDASTDSCVRPFLRDFVKQTEAEVELIENPRNLGFIRSVNKGFERALAYGDHVLLLNSDAFLPRDWVRRLFAPILEDRNVASVTPMSNDATIFTAPHANQKCDLVTGQGDIIDAAACMLRPALANDEVPTGVGFCMAVNVNWLRRLPDFDTQFGGGYGEEVDWCQRARALGAVHAVAANLFVEHRGGVSFGSERKKSLLRENGKRISKRYPQFDLEVQRFLAQDALLSHRVALGLAWLGSASTTPVPIYLAHSLGGGSDMWLERRLADDLEDHHGAVVLRVGGDVRWQVELISRSGREVIGCKAFEQVEKLLAPLAYRRIVYSCGVGDPDPVSLPDHLLALATAPDHQVEVLFHDFFPISPSYTLLDSRGVYRGVEAVTRDCSGALLVRPDGRRVTASDWAKAWGRLLVRADRIEVFSQSSADIVRKAYPLVTPIVSPHVLSNTIDKADFTSARTRTVVAALGNLNHHKGANVVADMVRRARGDKIALVVLGEVDPTIDLPEDLLVHGGYSLAEVPELVRRYGITHWLIPSIWPETFSYTTHEALATGLPVLAFDLGGQGDAVRAADNGWAVPLDPDTDPVTALLVALRKKDNAAGRGRGARQVKRLAA